MSFATWRLDGAVPVGDLEDKLGDASPATIDIYIKASPNHRQDDICKHSYRIFSKDEET
jgi:hypothetical protein